MLALISNLAGNSVQAVQTWVPVGSGNWFIPANWSPSGVPNSALLAAINNGGTAQAIGPSANSAAANQLNVGKNGGTGNLSINAVNVAIQGSIDVGDVDAIAAMGAANLTSMGTASFTNVASAAFGIAGNGDINVGQTAAAAPATARATGTLTLNNVGAITTTSDFDVGQTGGDGTATGNGTLNATDITTRLQVGADFDIGQTAGSPGSQNSGTGRVNLTRIAHLEVAGDVDLAQVTGDGHAMGTGNITAIDVVLADIGTNFDIGKVRALNNAVNSATAIASWTRGDLNVGFGSVANPSSLEIAHVLVSETARGTSTSMLTVNNVDVKVANDIIIGQLTLGSTNTQSAAHGTMVAIDSNIRTRDLMMGLRLNSTSGTVSGRLQLTRSLVNVQSVLSMSHDATVRFDISGTVRADGTGGIDQYGAIDADMAVLAGTLAVVPESTYADPAVPGSVNSFGLIQTIFGLTGRFDAVTYNGQVLTADFGSLATGFSSYAGGGLFRVVSYTNTGVTLDNYKAIPGDANGDFVVDGSDFGIWNSNKFRSGTNWTSGDFTGDGITDGSDFGIWNSFKFTRVSQALQVPEPISASVCLVAAGLLAIQLRSISIHNRR